jgi:8-oxo-dGTP pyrophosphatase MutT (NUDIX family)
METSAGLLIIKDGKILLCHPTGAGWYNTYSIPKGKVDNNDIDLIDTAIRETKEEIGLTVDRELITDTTERIIYYKNNKGKTYKKVHYFPIYIDFEVNFKLQKTEIDWANFINKDEAEKRIFWRFAEMLDFIN